MYTIQGVIRKGINNAFTQFERLGKVGNNLANMNTNAYKTVRFEQMLGEDGYLKGAIRTDFAQGSIRITSNPYDVAIDGAGFIPVTSPTGEVQYTRDGGFKQGKDGYLVTNDGWMVGEGIQIPTNCYRFQIKPNGDVYAYEAGKKNERLLGNIPLVRFASPEGLEQADMNRFKSTEESGEAVLVKGHDCFKQHNIETSNTSVYNSTSEMLRLNASMIASTRMLKVVDDMYNKAINIREG